MKFGRVKTLVKMGGLTRTFILHNSQHSFLIFPFPSFRIIFSKIWFLQTLGTTCEDSGGDAKPGNKEWEWVDPC